MTLLEVSGISKKFHLKSPSHDDIFYALRDITFSLKSGECLGIIGANGSGKSNFVSFFSLLREIVDGRLALAVNRAGR